LMSSSLGGSLSSLDLVGLSDYLDNSCFMHNLNNLLSIEIARTPAPADLVRRVEFVVLNQAIESCAHLEHCKTPQRLQSLGSLHTGDL
jgi:hypothetical protein